MKEYQSTLKVAQSDQILAVIEGLPVSANGFFMTEGQLDNIEAALAASETAAAGHATQVAALTDQVTAVTTDRDNAAAELVTANARIAALETENASLKKKPAGSFSGTVKDGADKSEETKVASYADDKNPVNQAADSIYGINF